MSSLVPVSKKETSRRVIDTKLPVYVPSGKLKTHIIICGACHKQKEVPIYRTYLCNGCFEKGGAGELQGVTGEDQRKIANFVRAGCAGQQEDPFYL